MIPLGIQNDSLNSASLIAEGQALRASWIRIITTTTQDSAPIAERIRLAHGAGLKVILTVGGIGTSEPKPNVPATLRWINSLPRAEKYTWRNEPDLMGTNPCIHRRGWMRLRRVLGRLLLWGDFSPYYPLTFTHAARRCGHLPEPLDIAVHPYRVDGEGSMGRLHPMKNVKWWGTEYGQYHSASDEVSAVQWNRDLTTATRIGMKCLVIYDVAGPTWDTKVGPRSWDVLERASAWQGR